MGNKTVKFKHDLGVKAKDKITGFKGILTARVDFLTGCNRYCLQPTKLQDGVPIEGIYFDEEQIEYIKEGIKPSEVTGKDKGACAPNPS